LDYFKQSLIEIGVSLSIQHNQVRYKVESEQEHFFFFEKKIDKKMEALNKKVNFSIAHIIFEMLTVFNFYTRQWAYFKDDFSI
jgi:uncharacterized FlaG/YvyC family protein